MKLFWPIYLFGGIVGGVAGGVSRALGAPPWLLCLSSFVLGAAIAAGATKVSPPEK